MARQKKATAKRGRPAKDAAAPKRKYTRRAHKTLGDGVALTNMAHPFNATQEQRNEGFRNAALYMALETRKISGSVMGGVDSLIEDADKIRAYLSDGLPKVDPVPVGGPDSVVGSGADTVFPHGDAPTLPTASTYNLRDAAE